MKRLTKGRAILALPMAWCKLIFLLFFLFPYYLFFACNKDSVYESFFMSDSTSMDLSETSVIYVSEGTVLVGEIQAKVVKFFKSPEENIEKKKSIHQLNKKKKEALSKYKAKVREYVFKPSLQFIKNSPLLTITENKSEDFSIINNIKFLLKGILFSSLLIYLLFFGLRLYFKPLKILYNNFEFIFFLRGPPLCSLN